MTLFEAVPDAPPVFADVLDSLYDGPEVPTSRCTRPELSASDRETAHRAEICNGEAACGRVPD